MDRFPASEHMPKPRGSLGGVFPCGWGALVFAPVLRVVLPQDKNTGASGLVAVVAAISVQHYYNVRDYNFLYPESAVLGIFLIVHVRCFS